MLEISSQNWKTIDLHINDINILALQKLLIHHYLRAK